MILRICLGCCRFK